MTCTYDNPTAEQAAKAKAEKAAAAKKATTEEEYLEVLEASWRDYLPLCYCQKCMGCLDDEDLSEDVE